MLFAIRTINTRHDGQTTSLYRLLGVLKAKDQAAAEQKVKGLLEDGQEVVQFNRSHYLGQQDWQQEVREWFYRLAADITDLRKKDRSAMRRKLKTNISEYWRVYGSREYPDPLDVPPWGACDEDLRWMRQYDDLIDETDSPELTTTIEVVDSEGWCERKTITSSWDDLCPGFDWASLSWVEQAEQRENLADYHGAKVEEAELVDEHLDRYKEWLEGRDWSGEPLDDQARWIRRGIKKTAEAETIEQSR